MCGRGNGRKIDDSPQPNEIPHLLLKLGPGKSMLRRLMGVGGGGNGDALVRHNLVVGWDTDGCINMRADLCAQKHTLVDLWFVDSHLIVRCIGEALVAESS